MGNQLNKLITAISDECDIGKALHNIESGIDVNKPTESGCTPLMFAVMLNELGDHNGAEATKRMVEALLRNGANPELTDRDGLSASSYARQWLDPAWRDRFGTSAVSQLGSRDIKTLREIVEMLEQPPDSNEA